MCQFYDSDSLSADNVAIHYIWANMTVLGATQPDIVGQQNNVKITTTVVSLYFEWRRPLCRVR